MRAQRYLLDDVEQAAEVMGAAALGEIHQQLRGLFPDGQISIFSDLTQLRNHHHLDQLLLVPENTDNQEKPQTSHEHKERHDRFRTDFIELSVCAEHEGQDVQNLDPDHSTALIPERERERERASERGERERGREREREREREGEGEGERERERERESERESERERERERASESERESERERVRASYSQDSFKTGL